MNLFRANSKFEFIDSQFVNVDLSAAQYLNMFDLVYLYYTNFAGGFDVGSVDVFFTRCTFTGIRIARLFLFEAFTTGSVKANGDPFTITP